MKKPLAERFWSHVRIGAPSECWEWQANRFPNGYGTFWVDKPTGNRGAHRIAWTLMNGEIPEGSVVMHTCDNKPCVNPNHLRVGTSRDNTQDALRKRILPIGDRHWTRLKPERLAWGTRNARYTRPENTARGSRNGFAKLTEADVATIRERWKAGETQTAIARDYGVWQTTISQIVLRKRWTHIP